MRTPSYLRQHLTCSARSYYRLCKPRVVALIVFTTLIGMLLAFPDTVSLPLLFATVVGVAAVSSAAAACNCIIEQKTDAFMERTRGRPLPSGEVTTAHATVFAALLGIGGMLVLYFLVNPLTMWLSFATFLGYSFVYTVLLKPATPQNIVWGGAAGAMPPVLGWAAATNSVSAEAVSLFLIIFLWTPPHFWSLALYRRHEYAKTGIPILPLTHGETYTRRQILLYTIALAAISLLPFALGIAGMIYLAAAIALAALFLYHAIALHVRYSDALARKTFRYSITYLSAIFSALLIDHYFQ